MNRKMMTAALAGLMMAGTFASQAMADENTISLMLMGTEADSFVDDYVEIINNFNETNEYGVTVNAEFYENEQMKTKLATLMAANNAPDVFFTYELAYLEPFVNGGKVADLTDYLENDPEWKSTFSEGTLELLEYDGRNFAIPTQISLCVMFYNKQIFADNGLEIPKTWDDVKFEDEERYFERVDDEDAFVAWLVKERNLTEDVARASIIYNTADEHSEFCTDYHIVKINSL